MRALGKILGLVLVVALEAAALAGGNDPADLARECVVEDALAQFCYLRCSGNQTFTGKLTIKTGPLVLPNGTACASPGLQFAGNGGTTGLAQSGSQLFFCANTLSKFYIGTDGIAHASSASGANALSVDTNGARIDFGAGASDYASSDGTTVTVATALAVPSGTRFNWDSSTASVSAFASSSNMLQFDNELQFIMGTSASGPAVMVGTANVTTADVTSSGASNLQSYTLPANALTTAGRCLRVTGWGTALNNANAKTVALVFGGQTLITKALTPSIATETWKLQAMVCRSGASTQDIYAEAWNSGGTTVSSTDGNTVLYQAARVAGTQTETATIVIKGTTTVATTTDVTMDGLTVEIL